jgi:viologen exporter family transport system permease protein
MHRKLLALLRANWAGTMAYRANILIYMLSATSPLISLFVWLSLSADGPVQGYSSVGFIAYFLAVIFVRQMTGAWIDWELNYHIREGTLSQKLLKPIDPIFDFLVVNTTDKLFRLPIVITPMLLAAMLVPGVHYDLSLLTTGAFVLALALCFLLIFFSIFCMGTLSFWTTYALSISELWYGFRTLLSGGLAPLDLLPAPLPQLSVYLPFRYMLSFPVEILLGQLNGEQIGFGFAVQGAWLLAFIGLYRFLWARGLRLYSAVGA